MDIESSENCHLWSGIPLNIIICEYNRDLEQINADSKAFLNCFHDIFPNEHAFLNEFFFFT